MAPPSLTWYGPQNNRSSSLKQQPAACSLQPAAAASSRSLQQPAEEPAAWQCPAAAPTASACSINSLERPKCSLV